MRVWCVHTYLGCEGDLGRLQGVVARELEADGEDSAVVGASSGADDDDLPVEEVRGVGAGDAPLGRVRPEPLELLLEPRRPETGHVWPRARGRRRSPETESTADTGSHGRWAAAA